MGKHRHPDNLRAHRSLPEPQAPDLQLVEPPAVEDTPSAAVHVPITVTQLPAMRAAMTPVAAGALALTLAAGLAVAPSAGEFSTTDSIPRITDDGEAVRVLAERAEGHERRTRVLLAASLHQRQQAERAQAAQKAARHSQDVEALRQQAEERASRSYQRPPVPPPAPRPARTTSSAPAAPASSDSSAAEVAVQTALAQRGKPYVWGAIGPSSFDCSGLVLFAYKAAGISLPRVSRDQARAGYAVTRDQLQPGDLVAYYSPVSHIALYIGNGQVVQAPNAGDVVKVTSIDWAGTPTAYRRVV